MSEERWTGNRRRGGKEERREEVGLVACVSVESERLVTFSVV